jgi:uncharacterized protein YjiS (DUF1127 family)
MPNTKDPDCSHFNDALEQRQAVRRALILRGRYRRVVFRRVRRALQSLAVSACRTISGVAVGLFAALVRHWRTGAAERRRLQAMASLHALSDRDLKDIGVPRSGIDWAVRHGRSDSHTWPAGRSCQISDAVPIAPRASPAPAIATTASKRAA